MFVRRSLIVAALAISVARCGEQPTALRPAEPQLLDWADATLQFNSSVSQTGGGEVGDGGGAMFMGAPVNLEQKRVKFWAVRGAARSVQINYKGTHDVEPHPFLLLTTTDPQFVPGIGELAMGDSVLITVKVDPKKLKVSLEPTGLQFGEPAQLTLWYSGRANDENTDPSEAGELGLYYREDQQHPWSLLAATQSLEQQSFTYGIPHFSDYAVARRMEWAVGW